jgi:hypothetical protein
MATKTDVTKQELSNLRCQFGASRWGGHRYPPYAFTEQGVAMLSSVIRTPNETRPIGFAPWEDER